MSIETKHLGNISWVDLISPEPKDIRTLVDDHKIPAPLGDELISPSLRPHTQFSGDTFFLSIHIPVFLVEEGLTRVSNQEIDFTVSPTSLITTRYSALDVFSTFEKVFETRSILDHNQHISGTMLCCDLLTHIYKSMYDHLDQYRDALRSSEFGIFDGEEQEMVRELSRIHQQLLRYDEALRFHDDILQSFLDFYQGRGHDEDMLLIQRVQDEYERVTHGLGITMSYLHELRDTNNSLLTIKQNNTMQLLTIMAYISLPSSIIASIFGMNTRHTPFVGYQFDFWLLVGFMILISLGLFLFFKRKKWL